MNFKRNDIVAKKNPDDGPWKPYGRVSRRIDSDRVEVIFSTQEVAILYKVSLEHVEYSGYWRMKAGKERWHTMPSLRRLKQRAARIDKTVWKRFRDI